MSINVCNDRSMASITSLPSGVSGSSLVLISEQTASSSSTISFTSGIDSTYKEYIFKFFDIHAGTDNVNFTVGFRDGSTDYDATKTTTYFYGYNTEASGGGTLEYEASGDLAQGTGFQYLSSQMGTGNDECLVGTLHLFDPSSTTFVKHFMSTTNIYDRGDISVNLYVAGYCNVTAAIDGVQFKMSSGNIDSGTFKLYGVV
jgi:hypothetical protein